MAAAITPSSHVQLAKEWLYQRKSQMKPWAEFFKSSRFSRPKTVAEAGRRVVKNLEDYQSNYVLISILLFFYCVVTSPLLLIAVSVAGGGCLVISYKNQGKKIKILGRELSRVEQYGLVLLISLPLFILASAGSTVFWIIGASFFVIGLHASLLRTSDPPEITEQLTMEEV
ncbi:Prenylated Rab acceptor protein 1 [Desmophyllum pertusum]|uniref:PRA1 family protein n=1 Tax=Desmophyllum pertusum TaxID=174260 RepID=A0A9W9YF71_9CNID|nr:Prenylated Rab acceptor protein 1 [Desmophyllum pertusum]